MKPFLSRAAAGLAVAAGLAGIARSQPATLSPAVETFDAAGVTPAAGPARLTDASLGRTLAAAGLTVTQVGRRYDVRPGTPVDGRTPAMSAALSEAGDELRLTAWLDEPTAEAPREALLRMLAGNDALPGGAFYAYVPSHRRFVLRRVLSNENLTPAALAAAVEDLAATARAGRGISPAETGDAAGRPAGPVRSAIHDPIHSGRVIR